VVILRGDSDRYTTYKDLLAQGSRVDPEHLHHAETKVLPHMVCNLQFTSGTTGLPKAAMLTHQ
jgi:long-chain acyl-CoA synthetase